MFQNKFMNCLKNLRGFTVFKIKKFIKKILFLKCIMYDMLKYHMLKTYIKHKKT